MIRPTRQKIRQAACALCACAGMAASAATIGYVADGRTGPYCNRGYGIEVNVSVPSTGCTVEYAESETGPWSTEPVTYTDVCTDRPVWFRLSAAGYDTVVDKALITITPKALTDEHVWVEQDEEYVYDGTAKRPTPKAGHGGPDHGGRLRRGLRGQRERRHGAGGLHGQAQLHGNCRLRVRDPEATPHAHVG